MEKWQKSLNGYVNLPTRLHVKVWKHEALKFVFKSFEFFFVSDLSWHHIRAILPSRDWLSPGSQQKWVKIPKQSKCLQQKQIKSNYLVAMCYRQSKTRKNKDPCFDSVWVSEGKLFPVYQGDQIECHLMPCCNLQHSALLLQTLLISGTPTICRMHACNADLTYYLLFTMYSLWFKVFALRELQTYFSGAE